MRTSGCGNKGSAVHQLPIDRVAVGCASGHGMARPAILAIARVRDILTSSRELDALGLVLWRA